MKILVVEDNKDDRRLLTKLLEGDGYVVEGAENGVEALLKAGESPPDLVVSDILMPKMDGFTLCREWMKDDSLRGIPFVFYSATYTEEKDIDLGLRLGAARFIVKPEEPELFVSVLKTVIEDAKKRRLEPKREPIEEESVFLEKYNERLIKKLEDKMMQLTKANIELKKTNEELKVRLHELEVFHSATVGRELKMIELKKQIKEQEDEIARLKGKVK